MESGCIILFLAASLWSISDACGVYNQSFVRLGSAQEVILSGDKRYAYVASPARVSVVDLSLMYEVGTWTSEVHEADLGRIGLWQNSRETFCILFRPTGLVMVDVSNPWSPGFARFIGVSEFPDSLISGTVLDGKAYIVSHKDMTMNVVELSSRQILGFFRSPLLGGVSAVAASSDSVYVITTTTREIGYFRALDVSSPTQPVWTQSLQFDRVGAANSNEDDGDDVIVSGAYAYVIASRAFYIFSVPNPRFIASLVVPRMCSRVAVTSELVFITSRSDNSLTVVDISDTFRPMVLSYIPSLTHPLGVAAFGSGVCVASSSSTSMPSAGLNVLLIEGDCGISSTEPPQQATCNRDDVTPDWWIVVTMAVFGCVIGCSATLVVQGAWHLSRKSSGSPKIHPETTPLWPRAVKNPWFFEEVPGHHMVVPETWLQRDLAASAKKLVALSGESLQHLQSLMDVTFKRTETRDRAGAMPTGLRVVHAHRVENTILWKRYVADRYAITKKHGHRCTDMSNLGGQPIGTELAEDFGLCSGLQSRVNEDVLWHGTSPSGAYAIVQSGFDLSKSGSASGSLYGKGLYFAECSSKSDEYAKDDQEGVHQGLFSLLLCRVVLGEPLHLTTGGVAVHDVIRSALASDKYDSVLGDRLAAVGTYREFVIFDSAMVYPEYVVIYTRVFPKSD